jgi:hypothetical protein
MEINTSADGQQLGHSLLRRIEEMLALYEDRFDPDITAMFQASVAAHLEQLEIALSDLKLQRCSRRLSQEHADSPDRSELRPFAQADRGPFAPPPVPLSSSEPSIIAIDGQLYRLSPVESPKQGTMNRPCACAAGGIYEEAN